MDVWPLRYYPVGSRLKIDVYGEGQYCWGLLDHNEVLFVDRNYPKNRINSEEDFLLYRDGAELDLVVTRHPEAVSVGTYLAIVHKEPVRPPVQRAQHVILNFGVARNVTLQGHWPYDVPAFDAARLDSSWGSHTQEMKEIVMQRMRTIYDGLNVRFYFHDDPQVPEDQRVTLIYFGGMHPSNVGLAERIDYGNRCPADRGGVYTQNFSKYIGIGFSYQDLACGFANVAAHELGHLLGLNHTDDVRDVMNVSPTPKDLMTPKYFVESPRLDSKVFPTGNQDGAAILYSTLGGDWDLIQRARRANAP
jgi:hypothetical protein